MRNITFLLIILILTACGHPKDARKPVIAVSTGPQAWIAAQLLPDSIADVVTLLPPGADPESYEPAMGTLKQLANARVWFTLNTPGFEEMLEPKIHDNFPQLAITDVTTGVSRNLLHFCQHDHGEHTSEAEHHHEDASDPHLMSSLRNAAIVASNMSAELQKLFPGHSQQIATAEQQLLKQLKTLDDSIANVLSQPGRSRAFVMEHPSLGYFARDYGLKQIALQEGNKEPTPVRTAEAYAEAVSEGAKVMFTEKEHPAGGRAEMMRKEGMRIVEISLSSPDYPATIRTITRAL